MTTMRREKKFLEVSNLALIVIGDEFDEVNDLFSYDELFKVLIELHDDFKKIGIKNTSLKKKNVNS